MKRRILSPDPMFVADFVGGRPDKERKYGLYFVQDAQSRAHSLSFNTLKDIERERIWTGHARAFMNSPD